MTFTDFIQSLNVFTITGIITNVKQMKINISENIAANKICQKSLLKNCKFVGLDFLSPKQA